MKTTHQAVYDNAGQVLKVGDMVVYQYDRQFNRKYIGKIIRISDHVTSKLHRVLITISVIQQGSELRTPGFEYDIYSDVVTLINPNALNELVEANRKIEYLTKELEKLEAKLATLEVKQ